MWARVGTDYELRRWVISEVGEFDGSIWARPEFWKARASLLGYIRMYCTFNARDCIVVFRKEHVELSIVAISKGLIYKYLNSRILTPVGDEK